MSADLSPTTIASRGRVRDSQPNCDHSITLGEELVTYDRARGAVVPAFESEQASIQLSQPFLVSGPVPLSETPHLRVLVIEDDPAYARVLRLNLEASGYRVAHARTGSDGLAQVDQFNPGMIILDLMLPDMDGYQICREIREQSDVPIIMLTARREEQHVIQGLLTGADDYMTKPFSVDELLARMRSVLRRVRARDEPRGPSTLNIGDLLIDFASHRVVLAHQEVGLTATEFKLLAALARSAGRVLLQDELLRAVWGSGYEGDASLLRTTVRRLRRKLGDDEERYIRNVRAVGYVFAKDQHGRPDDQPG
jgi:DNA-binding response OmpR family regulator